MRARAAWRALLTLALLGATAVPGAGVAEPEETAVSETAGPLVAVLLSTRDGLADLARRHPDLDHLSRHRPDLRSPEVRRPGASPGDRDQRTARWSWPLAGAPPVVRGFDPPEQRWLPGHRGVDLAGEPGEPVLAVEAGVITFSGVIAGVGIVSVTHADGLRSTYQPVDDRPERGSRVGTGEQIGVLGAGSHCPAQSCLHLGAVRGRDGYIDPTPLLLGAELSLLPDP